MNVDDLQAIVQVFTEASFLHLLFKVDIGCRDDTGVRMLGLFGAQWCVFLVLQYAQQLGLHGGRKFTYLIEKDGAAAGQGEFTFLFAHCASECSFLVAKHVRLQQCFHQGGAVDGNEWAVWRFTGAMHCTGHQFLAGARLAGDQYRSRALCHQAYGLEYFFHGAAAAHHARVPVDVFLACGEQQFIAVLAGVQQLYDGSIEFIDIDGFVDIVVGTFLHGLDGAVHIMKSCDHNDTNLRVLRLEVGQSFQAGSARHADVENDEIGTVAGGSFQPFIDACRQFYLVFLAAEMQLQRAAAGNIIINDKDLAHDLDSLFWGSVLPG